VGLAMTIIIGGGAPLVFAAPSLQQVAPDMVQPKPISENVQRGLAYLAGQQLASGGWSEGEESSYMLASNHDNIKDADNIADTCMATLAFVRAGNLPDKGRYSANVAKAVEFVCQSIGNADTDSLYVTDIRGTRVQTKLGPYVDTFLASLLLAEVKDHM